MIQDLRMLRWHRKEGEDMAQRPDGLPNPVSVEACYLVAVLDELRALRADLARVRPEPEPGTVELREPARKEQKRKPGGK